MNIDAQLSAEPGWQKLPGFTNGSGLRTFVSGNPDSNLMRVQYYRREKDGALVGKAWFGPNAEGPPGHAHGGTIAALLDEAMGGVAWMAGHAVLAAQLTTKFRRMIALDSVVMFEALVDAVEGRKIKTKGRLFLADQTVFGEGEGLYIKKRPEDFGKIPANVLSALKQLQTDPKQ